jgi:hypothetical protein
MTLPEEYCCTHCGSTNLTPDARLYAHECLDCGHKGAEFRPITDVKTLAQIAILMGEANEASSQR